MWWRFRKHKLALISTALVVLFYLVVAFADFLAYSDPSASEAQRSLIAPQALHLFDEGRMAAVSHVGPLDNGRDDEEMRRPLSERQVIIRRDRVLGRAVLDRVTMHLPDVQDPVAIADFAEQNDVVAGDHRVGQLRQHCLVVADDSRKKGLTTAEPREQVASHFLLDGLAYVPGSSKLANGASDGCGHHQHYRQADYQKRMPPQLD